MTTKELEELIETKCEEILDTLKREKERDPYARDKVDYTSIIATMGIELSTIVIKAKIEKLQTLISD